MSTSEPNPPDGSSGADQERNPVKIALVLYPRFTALDIIGPFQVLGFVPGHDAEFMAAQAGPVVDDTGRCQLVASTTLDQLTAPDVVVVGGTLFDEEPDERVVRSAAGAGGPARYRVRPTPAL